MLNREPRVGGRRHWHGVTDREMQDRYLDLLLFATMCGGLRLDRDGGERGWGRRTREYLPTRQSFGNGSVMAAAGTTGDWQRGAQA